MAVDSGIPGVRLEPRDEGMHENTGEAHFNESMYFNFFASAEPFGGFLRIGNRPNEGYAETTVCLFLPDGRVAFNFKRPEIRGNDRFEAGGARFEVCEPFRKLRIEYRGKACLLARPLEMVDPARAFGRNPFVPLEIELEIDGHGPAYGGEREGTGEPGGLEFARGHYEQHLSARGRIRLGDDERDFRGFGLRDHSWGPRSWQSPAGYRWLTGSFGPDFGFMGSLIVPREGPELRGGFVHRGPQRVRVRDLQLTTRTSSVEGYPERVELRLLCEDGNAVELDGRVVSLIPLRHRRAGQLTRIAEGMTEWRCGERVTFGISEYLDQLGAEAR